MTLRRRKSELCHKCTDTNICRQVGVKVRRYVCTNVYLPVCLSVCPACVPVCIVACLSAGLPACLSACACLTDGLTDCVYLCLYVRECMYARRQVYHSTGIHV